MYNIMYENMMDIQDDAITGYLGTLNDCVLCMESCIESDDDDMLYEITESVADVLSNIYNAIVQIFTTIRDGFLSFFKKNEKKEKELAEQIQKNPQAAKQKIKVVDQKKLEDAYNEGKKKLENGEDYETVHKEYKKKSTKLIKGVAITGAVITVGAGFYAYGKHKNTQIKKAENDVFVYKKIAASRRKALDAEMRKNRELEDNNKALYDYGKMAQQEITSLRKDLNVAENLSSKLQGDVDKLSEKIQSLTKTGLNKDKQINSLQVELNKKVDQLQKARRTEGEFRKKYSIASKKYNTVMNSAKHDAEFGTHGVANRLAHDANVAAKNAKNHENQLAANKAKKDKMNASSVIGQYQKDAEIQQKIARLNREFAIDMQSANSLMLSEMANAMNKAKNNEPALNINMGNIKVGAMNKALDQKTQTPNMRGRLKEIV